MFRPNLFKSAYLLIFPLFLLLAVHLCYSQSAEIVLLRAGQTNERKIAGGQKQTFQISLEKGHFASVIIEQRGIDVLIRAFDADEKSIAEFDSELRLQGTENVRIAALQSGVYKLEIEAKPKNAP